MKKKLIILVLMVFSVGAIAQKSTFQDVFYKTIEMNKSRFKNVNNIKIGDTVFFPGRLDSKPEAWIADTPSVRGVHDCFYRLTEKYMAGELKVVPVDTIKVIPPAPPIIVESTEVKNIWAIGWLILAILFILVALASMFYMIHHLAKRSNENQINRNPVIPGGLSDNPETAINQLNAAYPGLSPAVTVERGVVVAPPDVSEVRIQMTFANGTRTVLMRSGEITTKVTRQDGSINYYRQHCGNLMGEILDGSHELPEGWRFVPDNTTSAIYQAPVEETVSPEKVTQPEATNDSDSIIKILQELTAMGVVSATVTVNVATVTYQKTATKVKVTKN
ncbi:MAG: hypothetical protein ACOYMB_01185 [Patescibacteria group bacterium]